MDRSKNVRLAIGFGVMIVAFLLFLILGNVAVAIVVLVVGLLLAVNAGRRGTVPNEATAP